MSSQFELFQSVAMELALEAGKKCLEIQQNISHVHFKNPKDIVTDADLESDRIIREGLAKAFPSHGILTEETGRNAVDAEWVWIIDPIDGTVNFSRGMPMWGISIALVYQGVPQVAVCYLPRLDEMFTSMKGLGAFLNGKPIHVSRTPSLPLAVVSNGDFNVGPVGNIANLNAHNIRIFSIQAEQMQRVKCVGSAVVEGCFVAAGRLDVYSMTMSYPWDIAGVALLVQEAGGKVTHIDGTPLEIKDGAQVVFSNGILHQKYLEITQGAHS